MGTAYISPDIREKMRMEYITRNKPLRNLAVENDVDLERLNEIAKEEGWEQQRDEYWRSIYNDILHATRSATAQLMVRTTTAAERLVKWANDAMVVQNDNRVIVDPEQVGQIAQVLKVGLEVLKFTLGEPDSLTWTARRVEPEDQQHVYEAARERLKRTLKLGSVESA